MEALIGSRRTATYLTCLVLAVFCVLIMTGWWYLLAPTIGQKAFSGLIAFVLTVLAAFSARQIGQYRADAIIKGESRPWYHGWKPYTFLAIISALGTLNAAFVLFESKAILRHDISTVRDAYSTLRDTARQNLIPTGYFEKNTQVDALLKHLHEEIVNPNGGRSCGVGQEAIRIISEITNIIPNYRVLIGSAPIYPCDVNKAQRVYNSYANMAHEMIKSDSAFLQANGPAKLTFLTRLDAHYAQMDDALGALEVSASGVGPAENLDKHALYEARDDYNADRKTFLSINGMDLPSIHGVDALQSDEVNSYASTLELFWKRTSNPTTWFYLMLAIAIDFVVIYLLTQLNVRFAPPKSPVPGAVGLREIHFLTDPRFLWTNPH